jgi:hypothetical protein
MSESTKYQENEEYLIAYLSGINNKDLITWPIQCRMFGGAIAKALDVSAVSEERLQELVREYFQEAEHSDGETVWNQFGHLGAVYQDLELYLEATDDIPCGGVLIRDNAVAWLQALMIVVGEDLIRILNERILPEYEARLAAELLAERQGMRIKIRELEDRLYSLENPPAEGRAWDPDGRDVNV